MLRLVRRQEATTIRSKSEIRGPKPEAQNRQQSNARVQERGHDFLRSKPEYV